MRYRISHTTKFSYSEPVPVCQNKVHLRPRTSPRQRCRSYRLLVHPEPVVVDTHLDYFGNTVDYFSLIDSHRGLSVTATSEVEVASSTAPNPHLVNLAATPAWEDVVAALRSGPPQADVNTCLFAYRSDYIDLDRQLDTYARASFTPKRPIGEAAQDLTRRIYEDFEYKPHSTNVKSQVAEVFKHRAGVCQDFAHLQIACLRSLGLAARYVSGYLRTDPPAGKPRLVGADASHAWASVYCGTAGWVDFDPTNNVIPQLDHITVAVGRDYGDVCPIQGVFVGGGDHTMTVSVDVAPLE